ncbi:MAG: Fic family protein [Paludibacteraceae bacterium]|nr:Fic family protein [Paludibacteraceae bacterium]
MNKNEIKLSIPHIEFDMPIIDLIMELEKLRYKHLQGSTHPLVFMQLKALFHMLESIGSSRIEGNNTTIVDYVESAKLNTAEPVDIGKEQIREITNIENAMRYLEENIENLEISVHLVRELHQLTVDNLSVEREGAMHPGAFRNQDVHIKGSTHVPPTFSTVDYYMGELIDFVNREDPPKYDLLKIAIAHHRFVWIHPFENGNGRVVRLFTYAMLLKKIFRDKNRIINPTAVFCSDRQAYYDNLSAADSGDDSGMIQWAEYMLEGLKGEIEKIDQLCDYSFLRQHILLPSLTDAVAKHYLTPEQAIVLKQAICGNTQELVSSDLVTLLPSMSSFNRSRLISSMKEQGLLLPVYPNARKYVVSFSNNYWMRSVLATLDKLGFLPVNEKYRNN